MTVPENIEDFEDEIFSLLINDQQDDNKRKAVRYIRKDIKASISKTGRLFSSKKTFVTLIDISSKGAAITSKKKIPFKKIVLILTFPDQKKFSISATIAYRGESNKYGLKFDKYNDELGNHMFATQDDLLFK